MSTPTQERPARERLVDAAIAAFSERGYAATTTRDIASRAGMSPAAVYVHYASKEELLHRVSLEGHRTALAALTGADDETLDPGDRLASMVAAFTRWHAHHSRVARVVQHELGSLAPENRAEIDALRHAIEESVRTVLVAGHADGSFRVEDVRGTALAILSLSIDLTRWYRPGHALTPDHLADLHASLARRMVVA